MAKQSEASKGRKRKHSKAIVEKGKEAKRRRPKPEREEKPDEELLRVLTGQDGQANPLPGATAKPTTDAAGTETQAVGSGVVGAAGPTKKDGRESTESGGGTAAKKSARLAWQKALSEAHAKKINVTVLLENANLETVKQSGRSGGFVLLNCDDHRHVLKKMNREANDARPDITHQCLLALMDSPLNKAGRLKVYVRTSKNVLIEIHAQTRIPRTFKRFSGLMAELLEKFKVRGTSGSTPLLKVIRNPITSHLAVGTRKIVCTYNTENVVDIREHAGRMAELVLKEEDGAKRVMKDEEIESSGESVNVLYVVGAMAHGKIVEDWADDYICVSEYPLSAASVCSRITYGYECLFGIM